MMKKIIQVISLSFIIVLAACNKDDINNTESKVGISRVTNFPLLSLKGERYVTINAGGTYTEEGVDATEGGAAIPSTVAGSVNTAAPGVYTLIYSAVNKDGFSASVTRTVVVYSTDASAASNDFSGNYARIAPGNPADGQISTWTKIAPGVYTVFNPGGAVGNSLVVIAVNPTGNTIDIQSQAISDGTSFNSTDEVYTPGAPAKYVWRLINPGYGTGLRTFIKQ